jgi:hypothetical protein
MPEQPDPRSGPYYVTVRSSRGTILAAGPFRRHSRALGLVTACRMLIGHRAELDPWCEYGYGTCRWIDASAPPVGALNDFLHVAPDYVGPTRPAQRLGAGVLARLAAL